ncbi:MAG: hypothetical protein JNM66_06865 [Bryobacterales bacterium]|nr:hypothetical protein [Bryobacterales bacterium]
MESISGYDGEVRIIEIEAGGGRQRVATFLSDDEMRQLEGLPGEAIIGAFAEDGSLRINATFREFLHETIGRAAPLDPAMRTAAAEQGNGRIVYIDDRLPEGTAPVPEEDVLGWFLVRDGGIVAGSYVANPEHKIEGENGMTAALRAMRGAMAAALLTR